MVHRFAALWPTETHSAVPFWKDFDPVVNIASVQETNSILKIGFIDIFKMTPFPWSLCYRGVYLFCHCCISFAKTEYILFFSNKWFLRFQWFLAFVTSKFITNINDALNVSGGYFFFGSMLLCSTIFIMYYAPETKGKTNEEMKAIFLMNSRGVTRIHEGILHIGDSNVRRE